MLQAKMKKSSNLTPTSQAPSSTLPSMRRWLLVASAVNGFLSVGLGAFGAHALKARWEPLADGVARLEWWNTASEYHLGHALALGLVALAGTSSPRLQAVAGGCMLGGIVSFCGSLYVMAWSGYRALGAVTPLGGTLLLAGWAAWAVAALRTSPGARPMLR